MAEIGSISLIRPWRGLPHQSGRAPAREEVSDETLFARVCRYDDHAAFSALVTRYRALVTALTRRILTPSQSGVDPDDIAQEVFVEAYRKRATFKTGSPLRPWLYGIAVNRCLNRIRDLERQNAQELLPERDAVDETTPEQALMQKLSVQEIDRAIAGLPPKLRVVLVLRYIDDMAYEEIADACGMPVGTVKTQLFRARAELRKRMGGYED